MKENTNTKKMNSELLTAEAVAHLDSMLRRLAMKRIVNGHLKMDFEDVVSELWINTLGIIERTGKIDFNYIAKASFYKMVDLVRYNVNHEELLFEDSRLERCLPQEIRNTQPKTRESDQENHRDTYIFSTAKFETADEKMKAFEILELFEEGSKEYKYIEAQMKILGIIEVEDVTELPERVVDSWIATEVLGYAGCKSNGYLRLRNKVRQAIKDAGYNL